MNKIYLNRSQSRQYSAHAENGGVGDAFGGAAYNEFNDPATAIIGSAVIGGISSTMAAGDQADAANRSADMQRQATQESVQRLQPYNQLGLDAANQLFGAYGIDRATGAINPNNPLQQRFSFDASNLQNTPGYQFNYDQGMRAAANSAASKGLGLSGAQLKGSQRFASGLAENTFNDAFNRALQTYGTNYNTAANSANRLTNLVNAGQSAAAGQGTNQMAGANAQGNYITQAGNAQAGGIMGIGNALTGAAGQYQQNQLLQGILGNNSGGGGGGGMYSGALNPRTTEIFD